MANTVPITLSSLKYIRPQDLASTLSDPSTSSSVAVIDVRDDDHVGGHIKGSRWVPVHQLDARTPELLRTLKDKDKVVFHCMLSQQRGPKAALQYARAKAYEAEKARQDVAESSSDQNESGTSQSEVAAARHGRVAGQEICVLEGGFGNWQARYGEDPKLTEGYVKDIWD